MQFTTLFNNPLNTVEMLSTNQRYKIECNSQHISKFKGSEIKCCLQIKDTKLNAIHNMVGATVMPSSNVVYKSKIQN